MVGEFGFLGEEERIAGLHELFGKQQTITKKSEVSVRLLQWRKELEELADLRTSRLFSSHVSRSS